MKKIIATLLIIGGLFGLWQCQSGQEEEAEDKNQAQAEKQAEQENENESSQSQPNLKKRGKQIAKGSGQALMGQLSQAISQGGLSHAIDFCSVNAIPITDSLSEVHGAKIARVSHKNRNPQNAADSLEMALISQYQKKQKEDQSIKPRLVERNGQAVYYHPIKIKNGLCLNCHGQKDKNLEVETYIQIQNEYPKDEAIGFQMGDLRGLWKIKFDEAKI